MRAFVCEVDHSGLRRFLPEDALAGDGLGSYLGRRFPRPTTVVRALLGDEDAEAIRADIHDGCYGAARGLLPNRAVELISLGAAATGPAPMPP